MLVCAAILCARFSAVPFLSLVYERTVMVCITLKKGIPMFHVVCIVMVGQVVSSYRAFV